MKATDEIIRLALSKTRSRKREKRVEAWVEYLDSNCGFPLEMCALEDDITGEVNKGDTVIVKGPICAYLEGGGIVVAGTHKGNYADFELHYLRIKDKTSHEFLLVEAYRKWFADEYGIVG